MVRALLYFSRALLFIKESLRPLRHRERICRHNLYRPYKVPLLILHKNFRFWLTCTLISFCVTRFVSETGKVVEEAIAGDEFVLSVRHIKQRRRHKVGVETLFSIEFPGSDNDFHLKLDRTAKRVLIESKHNGKPIVEGWSVKDDLLDDGVINGLLLGVKQDIMGARYTLYMDCVDHGTVAMTQSLKKMFDSMKNPQMRLVSKSGSGGFLNLCIFLINLSNKR
ncbi:uncharacterized protein LOC113468142 [Diaphorina citri]|uniref:Uncharacterized protein LOC113468142 n=1 Tax=Diaphorina citri TaxID=121845 RepID=A0A3Q0IWM4_DIACI|nr:uncharacterized protein LOC113468142 [Diaphorina citri]